jgi:photoactive yellow protein
MQLVSFGATDIENKLSNLNSKDFNDLAFGAVKLDGTGKIAMYNSAEGEITGRDPKSMIGKNFFTDVAPCTNQPGFRDKFDAGVKTGDLNALFEWTFDYNMTPTKVQVHMKKAASGNDFWVFIKRL